MAFSIELKVIMSYLTWHGTKKGSSKSGHTANNAATRKKDWDVNDIFRKLIEIADSEPYVKCEMIIDWITKAKPPQQNVDQVSGYFR